MCGLGLNAHDGRFVPECQAFSGKKFSRIRIRFRINDIQVEETTSEDSLDTKSTNDGERPPGHPRHAGTDPSSRGQHEPDRALVPKRKSLAQGTGDQESTSPTCTGDPLGEIKSVPTGAILSATPKKLDPNVVSGGHEA